MMAQMNHQEKRLLLVCVCSAKQRLARAFESGGRAAGQSKMGGGEKRDPRERRVDVRI
jgi:hypothetical protein